jgi:CheY-like chemotaxis protein
VTSLPRVLIVDSSRESRDVLRTLLELQGATTEEVERPEQAVSVVQQFRPHVIVLDADSDQSTTGEPTNILREAADQNDTPVVILGKLRRPRGHISPGQFVAKPYHYGPLIRKIDGLLAAG